MSIARMTPIGVELDTNLRLLNEAAVRQGVLVKAWLVTKETVTEVGDKRWEYAEDPVRFYAIFETQPSIRLLKHAGWYREDSAIQPQILNVPSKVWLLDDNDDPVQDLVDIHWRDGTVLEFGYDLRPEMVNKFIVYATRTDIIPFVYYSSIVPFRSTVPVRGDLGPNVYVDHDGVSDAPDEYQELGQNEFVKIDG